MSVNLPSPHRFVPDLRVTNHLSTSSHGKHFHLVVMPVRDPHIPCNQSFPCRQHSSDLLKISSGPSKYTLLIYYTNNGLAEVFRPSEFFPLKGSVFIPLESSA